jgi:hypothetical protein
MGARTTPWKPVSYQFGPGVVEDEASAGFQHSNSCLPAHPMFAKLMPSLKQDVVMASYEGFMRHLTCGGWLRPSMGGAELVPVTH